MGQNILDQLRIIPRQQTQAEQQMSSKWVRQFYTPGQSGPQWRMPCPKHLAAMA